MNLGANFAIISCMYRLEFEVPAADVIPPYNHVHHAQVLRYLEMVRLRFMQELGFPIENYLKKGLFLVIAGINVRYLREILGGTITITLEEPRVEDKACLVLQRVYNHRGKLALEATVDSRFMSSETKRAILPPPDFIERFLSVARNAA